LPGSLSIHRLAGNLSSWQIAASKVKELDMNSDTMKGQWKQVVGRAKVTWGALTDDDLLRVEGDMQRLSGKLQERYGITREEAERQVRDFMDKQDTRH